MKKNLQYAILFLFVMLLWSPNLFAGDIQVSGAGISGANRVYTDYNGYYCSFGYCMGYNWDEGYSGRWVLMDDFGMTTYYYSSLEAGSSPLGLTWYSVNAGYNPAPSVTLPGPTVSYGLDYFQEASLNDGSIDSNSPLIITLQNNETFTGSNNEDFVALGKATTSNLPSGYTVVIIRTNATTLSVTISGQHTPHNHSDSISNLTFAFQNSAFTSGNATGVANSIKSNLKINFIDVIPVGSQETYTTIAAALAVAKAGDMLSLAAETFTEANITINKKIGIIGVGAGQTIVQAHQNYDQATNRVFYNSSSEVFLKGMTIRHGKFSMTSSSNGGGAIRNGGTLIIDSCEIVYNKVINTCSSSSCYGGFGGAIYNSGTMAIQNCFIANNTLATSYNDNNAGAIKYFGGAIWSSGGAITLINNTFANNASAESGGAVASGGAVTINNCTFYGNTAGEVGGAIFIDSNTTTIKNSLFASNISGTDGDDIFRNYGGTLNVAYCLYAEERLWGGVSGINGSNVGNIINSTPQVSTPTNNGGRTWTCAIASNSPARNAANATNAELKDQRGCSRDASPDMGAYEYGVSLASLATVTTEAVGDIGSTNVTGHGTISATGGANPTNRGVCWSTNHNPTITDGKNVESGSFSIGSFSSAITGLTAATFYYVRAYVVNSAGTVYGDEVSFTTLKITPTVTTWPAAGAISEGQALSASMLTGGATSVGGGFAFESPTTIPPSGNYSAAVIFTPTDTVSYNSVTGSVTVMVAVVRSALRNGPWSDPTTWSGGIVPAVGNNVVIGPGFTVTLDADSVALGNVMIEGTLTVPGAQTLKLSGNFTNNGAFNPGAGTVELCGGGDQTLGGNTATSLTFYKLTINKAAKTDTVTATSKLKVTRKLTITRGKLISASDYQDIEIQDDGELELTDDITVGGDFINSGALTTGGYGITFDGAVEQNLTLNVVTWFDDLTVVTDTTLIETETADNALVNGALLNHGVIRKSQPVTSAEPYYFGLAGRYNDADMEINVTDRTGADPLTSLRVDRIDANHPNPPGTNVTALYWTITPIGSNYTADLTLPHAGLSTPKVCRYTGANWDCARTDFDDTIVTREGISAFSDWAVYNVKATATVMLGSLSATYDGAAKAVTATTDPTGLTVIFTYDDHDWAPTNPGSYAVTGTVVDAEWEGSARGTLTIGKGNQTVVFPAIAPRPVTGSVGLSATASSGLSVSFSVLSGPGSIAVDGTNLTFSGVGTAAIVASQLGDNLYNAAPDVTNLVHVFSVTPNNGPFAGGNTITITNGLLGNGSDITNVVVGTVDTTNIVGQGANWVSFVALAAGSAGAKDIVVQSADAGVTTLLGAYTVNPVGGIVSVTPVSGSYTGGYPVVITGANLCNGSTSDVIGVTLCGVTAAVQSVAGSTQIVCVADVSSAPGLGDVRVYSVSFGETVKSNAFTYNAPGLQVLGTNGAVIAGGEGAAARKGADFGHRLVGSSTVHTFSLTNNGTDALTISGWSTNGDVSSFTISDLPSVIAVSSVVQFNVTFTPSAPGSFSASLAISNDSPTASYILNLAGSAFTVSTNVGPYAGGNTITIVNGVSARNGVFGYGASSVFPTQSFNAANYWVDVVFQAGTSPTLTSIWPSGATPGLVDGGPDDAVELGVKFRSDVAGTITGIRFYKGSANTGTHVGNLWSSAGTWLATAIFTNETESGWQEALFATPVAIVSNTVYVASYHADNGHYSADLNYFLAGVDNPPLHALTDGAGGSDITNVIVGGVKATITGQGANWVTILLPATTNGGAKDIRIESGSLGATLLQNAYLYNPTGQIGGWVSGPNAWTNLGSGLNGVVRALATGTTGALYAGGVFTTAGGAAASYIAKWDGTSWASLGSGLNYDVNALAVGTNGELYAGGVFTNAGGTAANYVAKWDGTSWTNLGSGLSYGDVRALAVGTNEELYVGGWFTTAGGAAANYIARWNGTSWTNLGSGLNNSVTALAVGTNGELYAGGVFTNAGGTAASRIAKWDGTSWTNLGSGLNKEVTALALGPNGELYAGGYFTTAGGAAANYIAKWNGTSWTNLGSGMGNSVYVLALGPNGALYVGGYFTNAGGTAANRIVKWDGTSWINLGSGMNNWVTALAVGTNGELYVGGSFTNAGGAAANYIAKWGPTFIVSSGVSLSSGSYTGGYSVTISGTNFGNGADITNVTLCGVRATSIVSQTATSVVVTAGTSWTLGLGDARVYSVSFGETVKSNAFTYTGAGMAVLGTNGAAIASGTGVSPVNGTQFRPTLLGTSLTNTFAITNNGTESLSVLSYQTNGVNASVFQVSGFPSQVSIGGVSNFTVVYAPSAVGSHTASLVISNNAPTSIYTVNLAGSCYQVSTNVGPYAGGNTITITNGHFGTITNVLVGGVSATLVNSGANWATITLPAATNAGVKDIVVQTSDNGDITLMGAYTVNPVGGIYDNRTEGWTAINSLPSARMQMGAAYYNGAIYAIGGAVNNSPFTPQTNVFRFNGTNWTEVAGLPMGMARLSAGVLNGYLYALGGGDGSSSVTNVFRYDGTNWTEAAGLPSGRQRFGVATYSNALYAIGGNTSAQNVYRFNGATWTEVAGLPSDTGPSMAGVLGNKLYAYGWFYPNVYEFNGTSWTEVAGMPGASGNFAGGGVYEGALYSVGGFVSSDHSTVYRFNGATWASASNLPFARSGMGVAGTEDGLYAFGGSINFGSYADALRYRLGSVGVTPASGSYTGGYQVVIIGTNLCNGSASDVTNVTVCGVKAVSVDHVYGATQLVVTVGAGAPGVGHVVVYSADYGVTVKSNIFTYLAPVLKVRGTNGAVIANGASVSPVNGTDFGNVWSQTMATNRFSITNSGNTMLTLSGYTTNGAGAAQFALSGVPASVSAGGVSNFTVRFDASVLGAHTCAVTFVSDATNSTYVLNLAAASVKSNQTITFSAIAPQS